MASATTTPRPSRTSRSHRRSAPAQPPRSRFQRLLRRSWLLVLPLLAVAVGAFVGIVYALGRVPLPAQVPAPQPNYILAADGHQIGVLEPAENRQQVRLSDVAPVMRE